MLRGDRAYIVVANRWAGSGKAHGLVGAVEQAMGHAPIAIIEPDFTATFPSLVHAALARAPAVNAVDGTPLIVCIGGDGTLSLALNALAQPSDATLAVVPCGSGNDLALMLGIASRESALSSLRHGAERAVDFGTVNGRRFLNCVGIGLDAEVAGMAARIRARGVARGLSYYAAALRGLFMVKPVAARVRSGTADLHFDDLVMLTIGNGRWYGGGFRGAPNALLDDGLLDCYAFRDVPGAFARFALMQRIRAGTHPGQPNVAALRSAQLSIECEREVAMHVDGELTACTRADVSLVRLGMTVLAPA